jgi:hypothetical protein
MNILTPSYDIMTENISVGSTIDGLRKPQQFTVVDDIELVTEVTQNERDGLILIVGARKL